MNRSTLLRAFSYLGLRGSRTISDGNSVGVFSQSRIQLVDASPALWQPRRCPARNTADSRVAVRGACLPMGQAGSFVRGYGGADEKATESSREGVEKGAKGAGDSANAPNDVNGSAHSQAEGKASADVEPERVPEAAVSPAEALDENSGTGLAAEGKAAIKPAQPQTVKTEVVDEAQTALTLALDELGEPPERPLPGDCCGQGCDVCVWDSYNDELRDYLARKKSLLKKSK